jgi:GNAT superfamily N-acetyltransferase
MEYQNGDYSITTDRNKLDLPVIHDMLSNQAYWSKGISIDIVKKSIDNSLNFGLFHRDQQVGFARVISDYATIAYLGDVFIYPEHRGKGLSKWMMDIIMTYPDLQGLRRWILLTSDAHGLYEQYGWKRPAKPELYMELHDPNVYRL